MSLVVIENKTKYLDIVSISMLTDITWNLDGCTQVQFRNSTAATLDWMLKEKVQFSLREKNNSCYFDIQRKVVFLEIPDCMLIGKQYDIDWHNNYAYSTAYIWRNFPSQNHRVAASRLWEVRWSGFTIINLGFFETQMLQFCLLT